MAQVSVHEPIVSQPAGWERTDHGSEAGWGACMCLETHQKVVCLGLVDGNARNMEARRGGGLHMCLETHQKEVCLGRLDGNARTIEATRDGG